LSALADSHDALLAAVTEVAENSLFAFADASDETTFAAAAALTDGDSDWLRACVHFSGPIAGRLEITVPDPLARHLCASFAGAATADDIGEGDLIDFVGELANMTCGSWLTRARRHEAFSLTAPRVHRGQSHGAEPGDAASEQFYLSIDDAPIRLELIWETAVPYGGESADGR
jgi:CheY-specific phosphatase CheX